MTMQPSPTSQDPADRLSEAARFVERFAEVWADPSPERLNELVHPDAVLVQPIEPVARGHAAATALWRRLFDLLPDLRGELLDWACRGDTVFIELRLRGTLDGRPVEWVSVDRIRLEAGKVRERTANFDPLPLIRALAARPRAVLRFLRARLLT